MFDEDKNFIGTKDFNSIQNQLYEIPEKCKFIRFRTYAAYGTTYNNDICINFHYSGGERDGEYEAYVKNEYTLASNLELRGLPKLDANNKLYYDGDTYESDGTVTRKYGIVDLGTLSWTYLLSQTKFYASLPLAKTPTTNNDVANIICAKYDTISYADMTGDKKMIAITSSGNLYVRDSAYTDATTFATAMNGVYLVYELATETTETADPFTNPQICDNFGTEEYVDTRTIPIPVGHVTKYKEDLKAKLEMAPDSPDSNGDYVLRHQNGVNVYVPHTSGSLLPETPQSDGEYYLKNTVSSGEPTLSWDGDILASLGLSIVNGELCVTYSENE